MRGSDPDSTVFYLARAIEGGEDPMFLARRIVICASEDVGMANPNALVVANSAMQAVHMIGMPEARILLSEAAIYVATSKKSNASYMAINKALEDVKTKDTGEVGKLLAELVAEIKSFDGAVGEEQKGLSKIFGNAKKSLDRLMAKYSKIETNVDIIEGNLEKQKVQMLKDIAIFDTMYEKNLEFFKEISLYIIAGEKKIEQLRNVELPKLKEQAQKSGEQMDAQKVQDLENTINRFEKKIYDLKTTRIISIQMAPQIRLLQNNEAELVEKIQGSITNTIPLWKNQIVLALGINNAKQALGAQKAVTNLTNDMLKKNSEILKQGSIEIAEESERAIVDIETLQKTNRDIIETLDKVIEIHETGRAKRQEAEVELQNIEKELKEKMIEIKMPNN